MKPSERYLKAAAVVLGGTVDGCCAAIGNLCPTNNDIAIPCTCGPDTNAFAEIFKPEFSGAYWFGKPGTNRNVRSLALCFMAAIAEDEERSSKRRSGR